MHCLVVRGSSGTIVRRWSPDTRLNGRTFDEAALQPGDRLTLGPLELEIIDTGRPSLARPVALPDRAEVSPPADARLDARAAERFAAARRTARRQAHRRIRRLVAIIRTARAERDTLRDDCAAQQHRLDELRQRCEQLQSERDQLTQSHNNQTATSANEAAIADGLRLKHTDEVAAFAARQEQWQAERRAADTAQQRAEEELQRRRAEFDGQQAELDALRAELQAQRDELLQQREAWRAERDAWIAGRERWNEEREEAEKYLEDQAAEIERQRQELENRTSESQRAAHGATESLMRDALSADEPNETTHDATDEKEPATPVDLHEVLRRYGASFDDEDDNERPAEKPPQTPVAERRIAQPSSPSAAPKHHGHDDEESIDDYMARLMQRVRGDESGAEPMPPARRVPVEVERDEPADEPQSAELLVPQPNAPPLRKPVDMSPRAVAPEKQLGLSAMRELANLSTQSALHRHQHRVLVGATRTKLLVAGGAGIVGAGLLWAWSTLGLETYALYGALAALLTSACWGVQFLMVAGRTMLHRRPAAHVATPSDSDSEPSAVKPDDASTVSTEG